MEKNVFILRVSSKSWKTGGKELNWDDLEEDGEVSFDGNCTGMRKVDSMHCHALFLGYNTKKNSKPSPRNLMVVCIGRIISDGCFESTCEKGKQIRFLVQKIKRLENAVTRKWMESVNIKLGANQPTIFKLSIEDWNKIRKKIILDNPDAETIINTLEKGQNNIYIDR